MKLALRAIMMHPKFENRGQLERKIHSLPLE